MAFEAPVFCIPGLVAETDLSAKQFRFIKGGTVDKKVVAGTAGAHTLGILQDKPVAEESASVMSLGVSKVQAGAAYGLFTFLKSDANGDAIAAATGDLYGAVSLEAATAAGQILTVVLERGRVP